MGQIYLADGPGLKGSIVWQSALIESIEKEEARRGIIHEARIQPVPTHCIIATRSESLRAHEKGN